jgi:transposase InsO family protein
VRPATPLICAFIDEHQQRYGVAPICRALAVHGIQIAPRTYWAHRSAAPSKRALWDTTITEILAGIYEPDADGKRPPESLYGSLKMWAHLRREGIPVARCTIERIMRANGWRGVSRARRTPRTTESDPAAARGPDALCETTIGLYKTECIRDGSPFRTGPIRTLTDLEDITSAWVSWYNTRRLMHRLARRPPAEIEAEYFARLQAGKHTGHP